MPAPSGTRPHRLARQNADFGVSQSYPVHGMHGCHTTVLICVVCRMLEVIKQCGQQPAAPEPCTDKPLNGACNGEAATAPRSCDASSFARSFLIHMPVIAAVSFFAMAIPGVIRIKYGRRLADISASYGHPVQQGPERDATADMSDRALPFETFGINILEALHLGPLLRSFATAAQLVADFVSETLILRTLCIPIGAYYCVIALTSRFAADEKQVSERARGCPDQRQRFPLINTSYFRFCV